LPNEKRKDFRLLEKLKSTQEKVTKIMISKNGEELIIS